MLMQHHRLLTLMGMYVPIKTTSLMHEWLIKFHTKLVSRFFANAFKATTAIEIGETGWLTSAEDRKLSSE